MQFTRSGLPLISSLLLLASVAVAQESGKQDAAKDTAGKATVGQAAPDFTLPDTNGKKHSLADYKDKVVVLQWFNYECPYITKSEAYVKELAAKYQNQNVVWLAMDSTNFRKAEDNAKYAKEHGLSFPILMDNDGKVGQAYGARTTPHVFVIDKGKLVYAGALHNNGDGSKKGDEVRNYVDDTLAAVTAGKAVALGETTPWGCSVKYKK